MAVQVMLISPALNAALREARFDGDAPLDAAGVRRAGAVAAAVPAADRYLHGPSERCAGTADALGLRAGPEPALHGWDLGRWSGRRLAAVSAAEPDGVSAWLTDPSAAPHGGESLLELCARAGRWLAALESAEDDGDRRVLAVVEPHGGAGGDRRGTRTAGGDVLAAGRRPADTDRAQRPFRPVEPAVRAAAVPCPRPRRLIR